MVVGLGFAVALTHYAFGLDTDSILKPYVFAGGMYASSVYLTQRGVKDILSLEENQLNQ
tara:strand:+ start:545 stop:721 length:177 start_codon:yes stop_codon:yes gene_type:complete